MAFLKINNYDVSVLDGSADVSEEEIGSSTRAFSGHLIQSTRARARVLKATTPILSSVNAKALVGLLKADGHGWEFDDIYSSKGLGAASGTYSLSSSQITVNSGDTVTFDTNIGSAWTAIVYNDPSGDRYAIDSSGAQYENNSTTTGVNNMINVVSGDFKIYGTNKAGAGANMTWDWAMVFPFVFNTEMHTSNFQFSEIPTLKVLGSALRSPSTNIYMRLRHGSLSEEPIQYMSSGSVTTGFQISFTLEEVL